MKTLEQLKAASIAADKAAEDADYENLALNDAADRAALLLLDENEMRGRREIYKAACRVLKNRSMRQFTAAKIYAENADIDHYGHYEISQFSTKDGCPYVVTWE